MQIVPSGIKHVDLMAWRQLMQERLSMERLLFAVIGTVPLVMPFVKMMVENLIIILIFLRTMATVLLHLMRVRFVLIK